jgi:hypothetical protein
MVARAVALWTVPAKRAGWDVRGERATMASGDDTVVLRLAVEAFPGDGVVQLNAVALGSSVVLHACRSTFVRFSYERSSDDDLHRETDCAALPGKDPRGIAEDRWCPSRDVLVVAAGG